MPTSIPNAEHVLEIFRGIVSGTDAARPALKDHYELPYLEVRPENAYPLARHMGRQVARIHETEGFLSRLNNPDIVDLHRPRVAHLQHALNVRMFHTQRHPRLAPHHAVITSPDFGRVFTAQLLVSGAFLTLGTSHAASKPDAPCPAKKRLSASARTR